MSSPGDATLGHLSRLLVWSARWDKWSQDPDVLLLKKDCPSARFKCSNSVFLVFEAGSVLAWTCFSFWQPHKLFEAPLLTGGGAFFLLPPSLVEGWLSPLLWLTPCLWKIFNFYFISLIVNRRQSGSLPPCEILAGTALRSPLLLCGRADYSLGLQGFFWFSTQPASFLSELHHLEQISSEIYGESFLGYQRLWSYWVWTVSPHWISSLISQEPLDSNHSSIRREGILSSNDIKY